MARLEISVMAGAESKQFLADLTALVDRLESIIEAAPKMEDDDGEVVKKLRAVSAAPTKTKASTTTAAKAKAPVVEEDEAEEFSLDDEAESEELSLDDLTAMCRKQKPEAIKVLKKLSEKCFDLSTPGSVKSITTLKPAYYTKVAAELGA